MATQRQNVSSPGPRRSPVRLLRSERSALSACVVATVAAFCLGVPLRQPWQIYSERVTSGATLYLVGAVLCGLLLRLADIGEARRRGAQRPLTSTVRRLQRRFALRRVAFDLRLVHAIALLFFAFLQLKHLTPFVRRITYDAQIAFLERRVFGGASITELLQQLLTQRAAAPLSAVYTAFYPFLAIALLVMIFTRSHRTAERYCAGFHLVWLIGIGLVWIVPTLGPCFFDPASVSHLPETSVSGLQEDLRHDAAFVSQHPESTAGIFLISGFPSLHLAVPIFTAIALRKRRLLAVSAALFAATTVLSTLYFGWHYLTDDLGAVALAVLAAWLSGLLPMRARS